MPETVSVKSSADYEVSLGRTNLSLHDKLSVSKLLDIIDDNIEDSSASRPAIYEYNPTQEDDALLQYIIDYPIEEFSLSMEDTDSDIENINFSTEFDLNIQDRINDCLEIPSPNASFNVIDNGDNRSYTFSGVNVDLETDLSYRNVTFESGSITVTITAPPALPSPDPGINLTTQVLLKNGGTVITSCNPQNCVSGASITLDLAGKTLSSSQIQLELCGTYGDTDGVKGEGSSESVTYAYSYSVSLNNLRVSKITGLNMTSDEIGTITIDETKNIEGLNSYLERATVGEGSLNFSCALPTGWTGVYCDEDNTSFTVTQTSSGGLSIENSDFSNVASSSHIINKKVDLAGKNINSSSVNIDGSARFYLSNATIVFSNNDDTVELEGILSIEELSSLTLRLSSILGNYSGSVSSGINFSTILSDFLESDENLIENVKFSGIEGYIFIQEPTNNETLSSLSANVSVSASYSGSSTSLIPSGSSASIKSASDTLSSLADSNHIITREWTEGGENQIYSLKTADGALDTVLNAQPEDLTFSYSIQLTGASEDTVTLTAEELEALSNNSSLKISLAMLIPFKLIFDDVTDGNSSDDTIIIEDLLALSGNEFTEDLLNRDSDWDSEDYMKYVDVIKSIKLRYTLINTSPLDNIKITLYDTSGILETETENQDGTVSTSPGKIFNTENGSHTISFSVDEIREILETQTFIPKLKMEISGADGSTTREFKRNSSFIITGSLAVETDGTVELWNKNDN